MIGHYIALIKRELWEHRSIFVTPIAIASIVTLGTLTALVFVGEFQQELNLAIFGAQNVAGETERKAVLMPWTRSMPSARTRASCSGARCRSRTQRPSFPNCSLRWW